MARRTASGVVGGALCALLAAACGQAEPSRATGAGGGESGSAWARIAGQDPRIRGLLLESRDQLTRAQHGFASSRAAGRAPALAVRVSQRASGPREVRVGGAQRLGLRLQTPGAREVEGELDQGRVTYPEAFPGVDVIAFSTASLYEELWVLRDPEAQESFRWELSPGAGLSGPAHEPGGTAAYQDALGRPVLRVGEPYAIDAAGVRHPVATRWSADGRTVELRLEHRGLPHPVVIDPPITAVPRWKQVATTTTPTARSAAGFTYSTWLGMPVLFGGTSCAAPCTLLRDLWLYSGSDWAPLTPSSSSAPKAVAYPSFFSNGGNSTLRLFGGWDGGTQNAQELTFNANVWSSLPMSGPLLAREAARVVWNPSESRLLLFGGQSIFGLADFTWEVPGGTGTFTQTTDSVQPPLRRDHGLVYDPGGQQVLVFGGRPCVRGQTCPPLADVWSHAAGGWTEVTTTGTPPPGRWGQGFAFDEARGAAVVFGGRTETAVLGDTYELVGGAWTLTVAEGKGPPARAHAAMAYDVGRKVTVLFGGEADLVEPETTGTHLADTWEYGPVDLTCTTGTQCDTGYCVDGACCDAPSCGTCQSCATADAPGTCATVAGPDPDSCASTCVNGACGLPAGSTCAQATECADGFCAGGFCCATACSGGCESCATGACAAEPAGSVTAACPTTRCDGTSHACPTQCATNADCAPGYGCGATTLTCQRDLGAQCGSAQDCVSGFCVDGVCCNAACDKPCDTCAASDGAPIDGTCGPATAGLGGTPACPTGSSCDGVHAECSSQKACASGGDCPSGVCIDSRCCASLYDCGSKCSADGTAEIDVATNTSTPCANGCYFGRCAAGPVDCRISQKCPEGQVCSPTGVCGAKAEPKAPPFDAATPLGCLCRATGARAGAPPNGGVAAALLLLAAAWSRRRARKPWAVLLAGGAALSSLAGCTVYDAEPGEPCRQAGYSISSRVYACTGDEAQANAIYEQFVGRYTCFEPADQPASYTCAGELRDVTCENVQAYGADLDRWVTSTNDCVALLAGATASSGDCLPLAQVVAPKIAACASPKTNYVSVVAAALDELAPRGCPAATQAELDACRSDLGPMSCTQASPQSSAIAWSSAAPHCSGLLKTP